MKKGILYISLIFTTIFGLLGVKSFRSDFKMFSDKNIISEIKANDNASYTVQDFSDYLEDKREHYPLSDEFIERYQQTSGGYIDYAKKCGIPVDKYNHSPNQKWHFFTSWLDQSLADGSLTMQDDAKSRIYTKLLCPELLLWIYEALGVDPVKVNNAKEVAEAGKSAGTAVSTIAKNMRAQVSWEDLIVEISKTS